VPDVKDVDHLATNDEQNAITTSALAVEELADVLFELAALGGDGTALGIPLQRENRLDQAVIPLDGLRRCLVRKSLIGALDVLQSGGLN